MTTRYAHEDPLETFIACFGTAKLIRTAAGRFVLRGGTQNDLLEAREWTSMFMPEVTLARN